MTCTTDYLGNSDFEIERLKIQAAAIADITRRLIRECKIQRGMRALDVGCGPGDVSMLLAETVGPSGLVVAIDREARAIETALRDLTVLTQSGLASPRGPGMCEPPRT